jgi:cell division protein FtsB
MARVLYKFLAMLAVLAGIGGSLHAAQAELRLDEWTRYGSLAEQGGICAGFAKIMEMQNVIDGDAGRLWLERRKYAGAIVREASLMEGLPAATDSEINRLVEDYAMWLVTNLVTDGGGTGLDESAHERTGKMVADLCGTLFTQADAAINQNLPELMTCPQSVTAATPNESCTAETEAATALRERIVALDQKTATLRAEKATLKAEMDRLKAEATTLKAETGRLKAEATTLKAETGRLRTDLAMRARPAEEDDGLVADGLVADGLVADNLAENEKAENDTAGDDPAEDGVTAARATDGEVSLPASKPVVIAQLGSYQRYEQAVSGVAILRAKISGAIADIRIDIAEARLVNDMPVFRLLTQPLTKAHSNRVCAAMRQAGFSCMLRGRK